MDLKILVLVLVCLQISYNITKTNAFRAYHTKVNCKVPKFAPYVWVKRVTSNSIILDITDPNDPIMVKSYTLYYWGMKYGVDSSIDRHNRHFGQINFRPGGPYIIDGLRPSFVYCADITANSNCGHGPFCLSCFENIRTKS